MPQMAPMNWLFIFTFFMLMFYLIMNIMYFNFLKTNKNKNFNKINLKNYNKFI